jgi:hypothetical protein
METQWPEIVDPEYVIGMGVRIQDCIHMLDALADRLFPEVRSGVDQNQPAVILDHDGRAGAAVMWIGRVADSAVTANRRHAHRCAAA